MAGKPLIFICPMSASLQKLKDTVGSDEAYEIYEIDSIEEYTQLAVTVGASLTISSDIKKLAKILTTNKKIIKKFNSKVLLLHDAKLSTSITQKLDKLGLNEVLYEPIIPKTLLYKVGLLSKSLKNPVTKDNSDVVLKTKAEAKTDSEVKVDEKLSNSIEDKKLTGSEIQAPVEEEKEIKAKKKNEISQLEETKKNAPDIQLNLESEEKKEKKEAASSIDDSFKKKNKPGSDLSLEPEENKKKENNLDLQLNDKNSKKKSVSLDLEEVTKQKKQLDIPENEDLKPKEKKSSVEMLDSYERKRENNKLQLGEEKKEKSREEKSNLFNEVAPKKKIDLEIESADYDLKKPAKRENAPVEPAEKTPQQKLEEKREKLRKLKLMLVENQDENLPRKESDTPKVAPELKKLNNNREELSETKALKDKTDLNLEEETKKEIELNEEISLGDNKKKKTRDLNLEEEIVKKKDHDEITEEIKKSKKKEVNLFDEVAKTKKDFDLGLFDDGKKKEEEVSKLDEDQNAKKTDLDLDLIDDEKKNNEDKSNLDGDDSNHDKDIKLDIFNDTEAKRKARTEQSEAYHEGFKVKKPELDMSWDYEKQTMNQEESTSTTGEEILDYGEKNKNAKKQGKKYVEEDKIAKNKKNADELDIIDEEKTKISQIYGPDAKKTKKEISSLEIEEEEKFKTKQFYGAEQEKVKTKSFYKETEPEEAISRRKKAEIFIPLENKVAIVTEDEIIIDDPYVHYDTKGLEYIAGVRSLHYWEVFNDLRILEFVANKIMISKNAITTFYFKDPTTYQFELVYSGHQECPEVELYTGTSWSQFENDNLAQWEQTNLPTWKDPLFTQDNNFFIYPFYEQQNQLGLAVISFMGQVKSVEESAIVENILSASRCYFLLRYHKSLGVELFDKPILEIPQDNVISISIFAKAKSFFKGLFAFMKKAA